MSILRVVPTLLFIILSLGASAQSFNQERVALANFLTRMYENAPFDGVRMVDDYDNQYLMSALALDRSKYSSESVMNRVASVKAMSQASKFFNGANITSDLIIRTSEKSNGATDVETIEYIHENSIGLVKALEFLTSFDSPNGQRIFIFVTCLRKD